MFFSFHKSNENTDDDDGDDDDNDDDDNNTDDDDGDDDDDNDDNDVDADDDTDGALLWKTTLGLLRSQLRVSQLQIICDHFKLLGIFEIVLFSTYLHNPNGCINASGTIWTILQQVI